VNGAMTVVLHAPCEVAKCEKDYWERRNITAWCKSCLRHVRWLSVNKTCSMFLDHGVALPKPCEVARCEWAYGGSLAHAM
jgi:hypothetical protein